MSDFQVKIFYGDNAQFIIGETELLQRHEFCDGVVLAVAEFGDKLPWGRPIVFYAPIDRVDDIFDAVHISIDLFHLYCFVFPLEAFEESGPFVVVAFVELLLRAVAGL